jgi:hypothetical protein
MVQSLHALYSARLTWRRAMAGPNGPQDAIRRMISIGSVSRQQRIEACSPSGTMRMDGHLPTYGWRKAEDRGAARSVDGDEGKFAIQR